MPRIKLVEQQHYAFHYGMRVEPRHVSPGGHLSNDDLIFFASTARGYVFHSLGLRQEDLGDGSTGLIVADTVVNYKAEAFLFDDLVIDTQFGSFTHHSLRSFQRVRKEEKLIALLEAGMVTFDYRSRKVAPVPETLLKMLAG